KEKFVLNRSFEAPIELMFKMWTDPQHFSKWLPPIGFNMKFINAEIKPGGSAFYMMYNESDLEMYGKVHYREITQNRIVYAQHFCDKEGNMSRHPNAPTWPETMLTTITLSEEGANQTRVT